ncbi:unnamed protein product [Leptidea sinapis]|uniref:Uncharacterized protein n=1 Tax=Leptidea sinapis TaxID=189913 RepID=A0A5E4QLV1_9NEOP|nr:unnamed protein product [Leptidea sinapis]
MDKCILVFNGTTALMCGAERGSVEGVRLLLGAGADPCAADADGWSPLAFAAKGGHLAVGNWTPLMWASYKGHEEIVAILTARRRSRGPRAPATRSPAARCCGPELTPTTPACNHFEIVQMLLEHKPNVNALDKDGCTALAIACKEGYYEIALALINSGAYINVQDHSKDTPLIYAVKGGYKNIVEALLKKHVDVDLAGKEKKTPVYTAVEKGHVAILKLLLASNPDLELSSIQIVEILLRNPKNSQLLYKPNKQNETPYNIDMSYNKTILGQIFGARKLNTNEDNENMLGYELYSAALADMLSEPSLSVPITVGLWRRACCIPHIITFEVSFTCLLLGLCILVIYFTDVSCLDAFTGQQTRLVVVVDALDSCEQEKVLALLNAIHALCSDPKSPFILLLAIDPHIISKAVEINSRRAFSESNIGGWDYLRNMVQLPFYLQNSALRRVKVAQHAAAKRMQSIAADDFSTSLQRSVSSRRLSSTSELMSSQERIRTQTNKDSVRRLRPSDSLASSVASGLHRAAPLAGAADLGRVLLTDDYFSDVNPRSMRRLMNVLYVTGRLLKAFQIEFNWYQLASWVNLTEQWPFRTSWIIYHHETYEEHIDDSTSLKHIYEKVKPLMSGLREASTLMELDRDERKLEVFLSFHRATLTAADLKIFLPFTINLDPYIKKVIKEEHLQAGGEEEVGGASQWHAPAHNVRPPHSKLLQRKQSDISSVRLSTLSVERVCVLVREALGAGGAGAAGALQRHRVCGLVLAVCKMDDLRPILDLPFGDWELFKMLILNLRDLEASLPTSAPTVAVIPEMSGDVETEPVKPRPVIEHQRSRPSNVEKQELIMILKIDIHMEYYQVM